MTVPGSSSSGPAIGAFLLAIAGQAAALSITDAPPYAVYQHYRPWWWIVSGRSPAAWVLGAHAIIVCALAWRKRATIAAPFRDFVPGWRLVIVVGCAAFSSAVPTVSAWRFGGELLLSSLVSAIFLTNLLVVVALVPAGALQKASACLEARITLRPDDTVSRPWDRWVPLAVAAWIVVACGITSSVVMERLPHIDDSVSYLFQAKYHAAGRLYLPPPPDADAFQMDEINIEQDKWYGYGAPSWPMVLAVGVAAGLPWMINPLLGGLLILAGHTLIRRRCDRGTANATVVLLALSPWLIFTSAELMAHPLAALLATLAVLAFDHAANRGHRWIQSSVLAGGALGLLALTRPVEAAFTVVALAVMIAADRRVARALPAATGAGLVAAAIAVLVFPFNRALTGRATYTPQMAWTDRRWGPGVDRLGFGPDIGIPEWRNIDPLPGHGAADVVLNLNKNAFMSNVELFGWGMGSLLLVWAAIAIGRWRRGDAWMLATLGTFIVGYSFWWFSGGPDLGARYWYPLIIPMAAVSARGAQMLASRPAAGETSRVAAQVGAAEAIGAAIVVAAVSASVTMIPWRAVTKHYRYRDVGGGVRALATERGFEHGALVFVRTDQRSDYQSAFSLNPPTLHEPPTIYARDAGARSRARVVAHYPTRPVWVIGRNASGKRGSFAVVAGPFPPGTVPP